MTGHLPQRPTWVCAVCAADWPCETRRRQLLAEYHDSTVSLGLLMASQLLEAAPELPDISAVALYRRFVGWLGAAGEPAC